jgi:uncharacterized protein (DUF305 family)
LVFAPGISCRTVSIREAEPRTGIVQPGAPGEPSRPISANKAVDLSKVQFTSEDVTFMQGMISHHAQAVEMVALIATRTTRDDLRLLGRRIDESQIDEIRLMRRWLESRGQPLPELDAPHLHGAAGMPGMLSDEEMRRLAEANGPAFDRLFLELMIKHHEGALIMVRDLFAANGGQDSDIFAFASDVDADQSAEIGRMRALLSELEQ